MLSESLETDIEFVLNHSAPVQFADLTPVAKNSKEIRLVDETRQHAGSFKYRGAILGVSKHPERRCRLRFRKLPNSRGADCIKA